MDITVNRINYIKTASVGKIVSLNVTYNNTEKDVLYYVNAEKNDSIFDHTASVNKCNMQNDSTKEVLHNLYDMRTIYYQHLAARMHKYPYEKKADYQRIYKCITDDKGGYLNNDFINVVQAQNTFYAIDNRTTYGHYRVNDDLYKYLCRDNGLSVLSGNHINTLLYNKTEVMNGNISAAVNSVLQDVKYNTIYEIPGNIDQNYNEGHINATTVKAKNQYNALYDMQINSDMKGSILNARDYLEICNCNNQVYLKYKDNVKYGVSGNSKDNTAIENYSDYPLSGYHLSLAFYTLTSAVCDVTTGCYNIPQIEVLENINRGINDNNHKSTVYSIDVKNNTIFNDNIWHTNDESADEKTRKDKIRDNLKLEIKNSIRAMLNKLAPANTQLFSVTVN